MDQQMFTTAGRRPGAVSLRAGAPEGRSARPALFVCACLAACALAAPLPAAAATATDAPVDPDLATTGTRRAGPFHIQPFLVLKDAGYDDNVRFDARRRSGDSTATAGVGLNALLLAGDRGGLRLEQELDYIAFGRNTELNHWNGSARARGILLTRQFDLSLEDQYASTRERPSTEIDQRLRRDTNVLMASLRSLWTRRIGVRGYARHESIGYSSDDPFSTLVAQELNRDQNELRVAADLRLLPKTTFVLEGVVERIAFQDRSQGRDARKRSFLPGFRFDPSASIQGEFKLGWTSLTAPDQPQNDYRGTTGEGDLALRLGRRLR